jgi:serine protease AprX
MMTSVVACGNGHLSNGLYRGIASEADVVLVKAGTPRRVKHDDIRRALDWVVRHRKQYGIRIVNVSVGGDFEASYLTDALSKSVENATRAGILVCAAAGNLGHLPNHPVIPPASAPSALTVGGLDDRNRLNPGAFGLYRSSYGPTIDGLQKPEVIAPGIWVPAPILPGTPTAQQAELLARLSETRDSALLEELRAAKGVDPHLDAASSLPPSVLRQFIALRIHDANVISDSYKHVDGTSFASPIVASIAAQMIEADPALTPMELKSILTRTARPVLGESAAKQGFGVVDPRAALATVLRRLRARGN